MGLKTDIKNAFVKSIGPKAVDDGNTEQLASDLTNAIIKFLKKQTFTITEMKAVLEVEKIETVSPLSADVLPTVNYITPAGSPAPLTGGKNGVKLKKLQLSTGGGDGGLLISKGHAYIGRNPVDANETNEGNTRVELKSITKGSDS